MMSLNIAEGDFCKRSSMTSDNPTSVSYTHLDVYKRQGLLMRDALLRDLSELHQYQLISMHDARLNPSVYTKNNLVVGAGDFKKVFKKALKQVDYVWLIAPETDGALLALTELCLEDEEKEDGPILLGCGYDSTLAGTSKTLSYEAMQAANIVTLPVYSGDDLIQQAFFDEVLQLDVKKWVAKPEDGAGCVCLLYTSRCV